MEEVLRQAQNDSRDSIDVVYVLGKGSRWQDNELRYSLRSVQKYLKNFRHVYVVGECPAFLHFDKLSVTGEHKLIHLPAKDNHLGNAALNICEKVRVACEHKDVSARFLFMNDDHFLLREVSAPDYPYCFSRTLQQSILSIRTPSSFKVALQNTYRVLDAGKHTSLNYDIHVPIVYDKELMLETIKQYDWTVNRGYVLKSLYCNTNGIFGEHIEDCKLRDVYDRKVIDDALRDRTCFSIGESVNNWMVELLCELYPDKSKFEK